MARVGLLVPAMVVLATLGLSDMASAARTSSGDMTARVEFLLKRKDHVFRGLYPKVDFWFKVPIGWKIRPGSTLKLKVKHASVLKRTSTATIHINSKPVHSFFLADKTEAPYTRTARIPMGTLKSGWNKVRVDVFMRSSSDACSDQYNPALWTVLMKGSHLAVRYRPKAARPDLASLPGALLARDSLDKKVPTVVLMVPQSPSAVEYTAMVTLAARLGQGSGLTSNDVAGGVFGKAERGELAGSNVVVIAREDRLRGVADVGLYGEFVKSVLAQLRSRSQGAPMGAVLTFPSPLNANKWLLVVTGTTDAALLWAVQHLAHKVMAPEIAGRAAAFTSPPAPYQPKGKSLTGTRFYLHQFGFKDMTVRGLFNRHVNFTLKLPASWGIQNGAYGVFRFKYSSELSKKSAVEVDVDERPLRSMTLTKKDAPGKQLKVALPPKYFVGNRLHFTLRFFLDLGSDEDCARPYYEAAWVTLLRESYLFIPHDAKKRRTDLAYYPGILAKETDLRGVMFVGPDRPHPVDITVMAAIAAQLGAYVAESGVVRP